jgi:hypothetical protein
MTRTIALLSILVTSLGSAEDLLPLGSDNYTMKVTEEVTHPKVGNPSENFPCDEYRPAKEQMTLSLRFSKDRKKVEILPRGVSGELTSADANERVYLLSKGLFAGGRLIVERTTPFLPPSDPAPRLPQGPPAKSKFLAAIHPQVSGT